MPDTAPIKSIALFAPNRSSLYINALLGLRKQFVRRGIDCHVGWNYMDGMQLPQFCDVYRPDVIFEIDRTRNNAENMPKDVFSIAWLQDWRSVGEEKIEDSGTNFGGSDFYYFCAEPASIGADVNKLPNWDYLLQATDPEVYSLPDTPPEWLSDVSMIGYIPTKDNLDKIDHPLMVQLPGEPENTTDFGTIHDLLKEWRRHDLTWNKYDATLARKIAHGYIYKIAKARRWRYRPPGLSASDTWPAPIPDGMMYFVENEIMRAYARHKIASGICAATKSLRLYGIGMWQDYPEFADFFEGPLLRETDVRDVYQSTCLNVHNAMTQMHARVLDCMSSGAAIMVNTMLKNEAGQPDCLRSHFEPNVHYFEYDEDTVQETVTELLQDRDRCREIGLNAAKVVRAEHTWSHRVDQILADLARLM